jgi:prostaglandin reductase 1
MKAQKFVLVKHFDGFPKDSDLELVEEDLSELKDGEILIEALYLTVDPYMRPYSDNLPLGSTMIGQQVAKVILSKDPAFPVGQLVIATVGWRSRTVVNSVKPPGGQMLPTIRKLPDIGSLSPSLGVSVLGMTGATAYFGFLRLCKPKAGETVLVNAAAGAVGSMVGQIAKIKGCRVIGYAGTDAKCKWIKEELGFDYAFNYKTCDLGKTLKEAAPNGIDCYFDNVGGKFTQTVIADHMNPFGRISVCGSINQYNTKAEDLEQGPYPWGLFIGRQLRMEGFMVHRWVSEWDGFVTVVMRLAEKPMAQS